MESKQINIRHVSKAFGALPKTTRFPKAAAELLATGLQTAIPTASHAAAKVLAQHLHHVSRAMPSKGIATALMAMASDLGVEVAPYMGHAKDLLQEDAPISAFLGEMRRQVNMEQRAARAHSKEARKDKSPEREEDAVEKVSADEMMAEKLEKMVLREEEEEEKQEGGCVLDRALSGVSGMSRGLLGKKMKGGAVIGGAILAGGKSQKAKATSLYAALK